ncbi:MAG: Uncharacterized protein E1N59_2972 [Puniceicoccaceae bacterium 5H]|nr:MAG: Uncharacterized protein E1N59_2972 [Puniceicoccaceae bacterium 5H]
MERADRSEERVFRYLSSLPDDWLVVWGYRYQDSQCETREGDFLVLGPRGGLLVIEVKGYEHLMLNPDGSWGGVHDNPFQQLDAQWFSIINALNDRNSGLKMTVCRALALPNIQRKRALDLPSLVGSEGLVLAQEDLFNFTEFWEQCFQRFPHFYPNAASRKLFLQSSWGRGFSQPAGAVYSDYLDTEIDRLTRARFPVLDHLPSYRRFAITGAAGSGKTWLLIDLALRWAGRDDGPSQRVLLLCYNKALHQTLSEVLRRLVRNHKIAKQAAQRIEVRSWESLVEEMYQQLEMPYRPPGDSAGKIRYFGEEVPAALELALEEGRIAPRYDALVVDEAQDHSTQAGTLHHGWWSLYLALLHSPEEAQLAAAYDVGQRPSYWSNGDFEEAQLLQLLGAGAIRLHCPAPRRYTRQIAAWLADVAARVGFPFEVSDAELAALPHGFPVELHEAPDDQDAIIAAEAVAIRWIEEGLAAPEEILVIGVSNDRRKHALGATFAGHPLVELSERSSRQIAYISGGRCKGLESLAVILIGFGDLNKLEPSYQQTFFLAASRARQHLAVFTTVADQ